MSDLHTEILALLSDLADFTLVKDITLHNLSGRTPGLRSTIRSRAIGNFGVEVGENHSSDDPPAKQNSRTEGAISIGDTFELEIKAPFSGYLHLFNLGSSGKCTRLAPSKDFPLNKMDKDEVLFLPDNQNRVGRFEVTWPPTAESGHPDHFLFIFTRDKCQLAVQDLNDALFTEDEPDGSERTDFWEMFETNRAQYGLISYEVLEQ